MTDLRRVLRASVQTFSDNPAWITLMQLFLAFGWLRAAVAHGVRADWWTGRDVLDFLDQHADATVGVYEPFVDHVVSGLPALTAIVVLVLELLVAALLLLNIHRVAALLVGAFLNVQFVLAGSVNPSIFYLVMAAAILVWCLESVSLPTIWRLARTSSVAAVMVALALTPSINTMAPEFVIEDPALVLIHFTVLCVATIWFVRTRLERQSLVPQPAHPGAVDRSNVRRQEVERPLPWEPRKLDENEFMIYFDDQADRWKVVLGRLLSEIEPTADHNRIVDPNPDGELEELVLDQRVRIVGVETAVPAGRR